MTNVLVLWSDNRSANLGVRVLAAGMQKLAALAWPSDQINFTFQDLGPNEYGFSLGAKSCLRDLVSLKGPVKRFLADFDVVLDTGAGDSFADIYGIKRLAIMTYVQRVANNSGLPYILGPQTIGPFQTRLGTIAARKTLQNARLVMARDPQSASAAVKLARNVDITATDVVFLLDRPTKPMKTRDVIVNVSGLLWNGNGHVDSNDYQIAIRGLIDGLLEHGRTVSLLAHVLDNATQDNDLIAINALSQEYGSTLEYLIPTNLDEARTTIATGNALVGSRMHACLNALSVGVPAVPWAYSRKFEPLLHALGWNHGEDLRTSNNPVPSTLRVLDTWKTTPPISEVDLVNRAASDRLLNAAELLRSAMDFDRV